MMNDKTMNSLLEDNKFGLEIQDAERECPWLPPRLDKVNHRLERLNHFRNLVLRDLELHITAQ